ncbi:reverse transcriptase, partial [Schistosoma japonicum]
STKEEQTNCVHEIKCNDCNAKYVGEISRQLNVRMKEHILCSKHIPKSSNDILKLENKSLSIPLRARNSEQYRYLLLSEFHHQVQLGR